MHLLYNRVYALNMVADLDVYQYESFSTAEQIQCMNHILIQIKDQSSDSYQDESVILLGAATIAGGTAIGSMTQPQYTPPQQQTTPTSTETTDKNN
ncbi:hypothetical protein I4U23_023271 [Adineta vaga]|nr:hypothetical protein I4U23_023271 [Adineta vaga]